MDEEKKEFVETWTKTRDRLIRENTEAEKELSSTLSKLSGVTDTVNQMNSEIEGWKDNVAKLASSYGQEKQALISSIEENTKELARIENLIIKEKQDLEIKKGEKERLSNDLKTMVQLVDTAKSLVTDVMSEIPNFSNSVKIILEDFNQMMNDVKVSVDYFKNDISAIERQQNEITNKQNIRDNYLTQREVVVNDLINKK